MENVKRILPYVRRYVLMAIYDVLDEESISYHKEEDAIVGLMSLGYTRAESAKAVKGAVEKGAESLEDIIMTALKSM